MRLNFYRKKTAASFNVIPYNYQKKKEGVILLSVAQRIGDENSNFDWNNKINFAFGLLDIPHMLEAFEDIKNNKTVQVKLIHDKNAGTNSSIKNLVTFTLRNSNEAVYWLGVSHGENNISIGLSKGEILMLEAYFKHYLPLILFNSQLSNQIVPQI